MSRQSKSFWKRIEYSISWNELQNAVDDFCVEHSVVGDNISIVAYEEDIIQINGTRMETDEEKKARESEQRRLARARKKLYELNQRTSVDMEREQMLSLMKKFGVEAK